MGNSISLPLRSLIRENISIVLSYAFSRAPLEGLIANAFLGEWDNLRETVLVTSRQHAERALMELALLLRNLDDQEDVGAYVAARTNFSFGRLEYPNGSSADLKLRDVANKVIHAAEFTWEHPAGSHPVVVCSSGPRQTWRRAEIDLVCLSAVCGNFSR